MHGYAKTPLMEEIFLKASTLAPNWDDIGKRVRSSPSLAGIGDEHNFQSMIGEMVVRSNLERAAQSHSGVRFDPLADGYQSASFRIRYSNHAAQVYSGRDRYLEIDTLVEIENTITLVEVKLASQKKNHKFRGHKGNASGAYDALKDHRYERMSMVIDSFFGEPHFGYAVVLYPEMIAEKSGTQKSFRERNGILVPFYASREQFQADIEMAKPRILH